MSDQEIEVVDTGTEWEKRPVKDILEDALQIDCDKAAENVLMWLEANVENYIDNHTKIFKLDLVLDNSESMSEVKKLQDLYRAIPDDVVEDTDRGIEVLTNCRLELDKVTLSVYNKMVESTDLLEKLFDRLIYYYEMQGIKNGEMLIQEMAGAVNVLKFEYEAFEVGVKILAPEVAHQENKERKVVKQYTIPEGFTVWIEVAYKANLRPTSLF